MHTFDELDDHEDPWLPLARRHPNQGISGSSSRITPTMLSDRICASLVWAGLEGELRRHLFFQTTSGAYFGGFVFSPSQNQLNCAYGGDGGTNRKTCNPPGLSQTCVPGCGPFCGEGGGGRQCSSRPAKLAAVLDYQAKGGARTATNEMVFDQRTFEEHLPHSVEAIWWDPQRTDGSRERAIHQRFCERFGLHPDQLPFVRLGQGRGGPLFEA